jgi:Mg-chelatase subunit ChlD
VGVQSPQTSSNYYVVLDGSGSMSLDDCAEASNKITVAVTALTRFVDAVPKDANVGLLVFDGHGISERVPLGIRNDAAIRSALNDVRAEGGTPLRTAIGLGYEKLLEQARRQLGYGEYHLVLVTDGLPEPEDEDPTAVVADLLATTPVVLHTIGFCIGEEHVLNQPGRSYYVAADSPEQLQQGLSAVLAEAPAFDPVAFEN